MKNLFVAIAFMAAASLAADIQVLEPVGAEFSPDAPQMVSSILRAAVSQTGNTPVESGGDVQLRTSLMTMGSSIVVVCEQVKGGVVLASGKQKSGSIDDLDVAIENAVKQALANVQGDTSDEAYASNVANEPQYVYVVPVEHSGNSGEDPNDKFAHKRPTRNYVSYGLGMANWHNYDFRDKKDERKNVNWDWEQALVLHYARIFETAPHGAITIVNNMNLSFGDEWEWHETFLIGGRYFFSTGALTPYVGAGIGIGVQMDEHYYDFDESFAIGLAGGAELGVIFFRNSSVQLELGLAWDVLWDGFEAFDRRFGAGSLYIAINY